MIKKATTSFRIVSVLVALVCTALILVPLACVLTNIDLPSMRTVFERESFLTVLGNSLLASGITTVIALTLAYVYAYCIERTKIKAKPLFRMLATLPMLVPSISLGMGTIRLFGNNGLLTELFHLPLGVWYGLPGIVFGSLIYSFPVAFLMLDNLLKYEDSSPYEAADVLGIPKYKQFCSITIPYLRKPLITAVFAVFTLSFTDYGIPLMIGGQFKTLPVVLYQEVIGQLNFAEGCVYGCLLLIPAVLAFIIDFLNQNTAISAFSIRPFVLRRNLGRDVLATLYVVVLSLVCLLPLLAFVVIAFVTKYPTDMTVTLDNIVKTMDRMGGGIYLLNSVVMSVSVAVIGVALAVFSAYYAARNRGKLSKYLHLICMATGSIPGVVLGLAYVLLFKGSFFYGTLFILILVNTVHFFASPYLMMYTAFSKIHENMEAVAETLGIGRFKLLKDIMLPRCRHTVLEMFSYFFVNCMMTISAVSFLANVHTKPIALMINQFEAQSQLECAAVVSLAILVINLLVKLVLRRPIK